MYLRSRPIVDNEESIIWEEWELILEETLIIPLEMFIEYDDWLAISILSSDMILDKILIAISTIFINSIEGELGSLLSIAI